MSMSTFQKVTVVTCVCVCVALLLPKLLLSGGGRRDPVRAEGVRFRPLLQRKVMSASPRGAGMDSAHHSEAIARAKGGTTTTGRSNLAGQIIPVYGFGILLYILYIIYKITCRGKVSVCEERRLPVVRSEKMKRKITDFELSQLQERLKETEEVMEKIISRARAQSGNTLREECVSVDQEEKLLLQLREITQVMQEGRLLDHIPQDSDRKFTGPEEILSHWSSHCCTVHHQTARQTAQAGRQMDSEEAERAGRQTDEEEAERAGRQTDDEEAERAGRQTDDEEAEQAGRQTDDEEAERAGRQTDGEEAERAGRQMDGEEAERADRQMDDEEADRAGRQMDGEETECSDAGDEETCTEMMEPSEEQHWCTSLTRVQVIRRRSGRGTTQGTNSSH